MWLRMILPCAVLSIAMAGGARADSQSDLVAKGKYLTDAGDCVACHSAPGGQPFAGGLPMKTPFGTLVTPNITPDKATGIGNVSDDQFYRVLHEGIAPDGSYLYPVFPFPWYTHVTHDDALAIRAYLATVPAVNAKRDVNQLAFPFSIRESLLGWRQIFFKPDTFKPDPARSDKLNRGAYLVEGLGHCAECHTPHDPLGASEQSKAYEGAKIDDWYAPNISSDMTQGIGSWSEDQLVTYLKTGVSPSKAIAAGPMAQVVHDSLSKLTDDDVHAIAAYLKQIPAKASYATDIRPVGQSAEQRVGGAEYLNYCSSCHRQDGKGIQGAIPPLDGNGVVLAGGPQDVVKTILGGMMAHGTYAAMPAVGAGMTDQQIADVTNFVRSSWSNHAPATVGGGLVGTLRASTSTMLSGGACDAIDPALAGVSPTLSGLNEGNMTERAPAILRQARTALPGASRADVINKLIAAYCPALKADSTVPAAEKPQQLGSFAGILYSQLASVSVSAR